MKTTERFNLPIGTNAHGYVTSFRPARKNARLPEVGSALYVAIGTLGQITWSERRLLHLAEAKRMGIA